MRSYWIKYKQLYKKGIKGGIILFLAIGGIVFFILATIASRGMGVIFNEVMARQTIMRGTVTVESLSATPWGGTLSFTELVWKDPEGHELLNAPSGKIRVNMWDIVTRNFKASACVKSCWRMRWSLLIWMTITVWILCLCRRMLQNLSMRWNRDRKRRRKRRRNGRRNWVNASAILIGRDNIWM
nr:hypothetical protein [Veillonella denticariosi]